jgi:hypothetical protein
MTDKTETNPMDRFGWKAGDVEFITPAAKPKRKLVRPFPNPEKDRADRPA